MTPTEEKKIIQENSISFLSTKHASELSGYHSDYLARLCKSGKIVGKQIGRTWLVSQTSLEEFVKAQESKKQEFREQLSQQREKEYKENAALSKSPIVRRVHTLAPILTPLAKSFIQQKKTEAKVTPELLKKYTEFQKQGVAILAALLVLLIGVGGVEAAEQTSFIPNTLHVALETSNGLHDIAANAFVSLQTHEGKEEAQEALLFASQRNENHSVALEKNNLSSQTIFADATKSFQTIPANTSATENYKLPTLALATPVANVTDQSFVNHISSEISFAKNHPQTIPGSLALAAEQAYANVGVGIFKGITGGMQTESDAEFAWIDFSQNILQTYSRGVYAWVNVSPRIPQIAAEGTYALGAYLGDETGALSHGALQNSRVAIQTISADAPRFSNHIAQQEFAFGEHATRTTAGVLALENNGAKAFTYNVFGGLSHAQSDIAEGSTEGLQEGQSLALATLPSFATTTSLTASVDSFQYVPTHNLGEIVAVATYDTINRFFGNIQYQFALLFGGSNTLRVEPTTLVIGSPSLVGNSPTYSGIDSMQNASSSTTQTTQTTQSPQTSQGTPGTGSNIIENFMEGATQAYVDQGLSDLKTFVIAEIEASKSTGGGGGGGGGTTVVNNYTATTSTDITGTSLAISGSSTLSGGLSAASSTFTGPVVVNGNVTINGTLTAPGFNGGGSNGVAATFTATSTTGTSTFAGGVNIDNGGFTYSTTTKTTAIQNALIQNATITNATLTNASSTNFFATLAQITNGFFTNLTAQLATITGLNVTDSTTTNATSTNLYATNGIFGNLLATIANFTTGTFTNLFATNATLTNATSTNATSTNLYASNITGDNATITNITSTNTISTNASTTNATSTNESTTNLTATNATITNAAINGLTAVNATSTNATSTNFFATLAQITNGFFTNLTAQLATITGLTATNSTTTNATSTNLYATNGIFGNLLATIANFTTGIFTNLTATNATSTNLYAANISGTNGTITNFTSTNNSSTNSSSTNASSTNLYASNLSSDNATLTNSNLVNATSTNFFASLAQFATGLFTNLVATNATSTNLYASNITGDMGSITSLQSVYASSTNLYASNLSSDNANIGALSVGNLNGFLTATNGVVGATSSIDLTTDVTGVLPQQNGGTGISSYNPGDVLYADAFGNLTTLPRGTDGQVLKLQGGLPYWGVDQTVGSGGSDGIFATSSNLIYPLNSSNTLVLGGNTQSDPNSIFEAHGNSYFSGSVGIGSTTPLYKLSVEGSSSLGNTAIAGYFIATTTSTSTLPSLNTQNFQLKNYNGPLQANNGWVSATTSIGVLYGGTGLTTAPTYGKLLIGNSAGGYTLTATSSLKIAVADLVGTTDNLTEGSTNLYFTNARADARIDATSTIGSITALPNLGTVSTSLNGILHATAGVLSTSLVSLSSDITGTLGVANGGTGSTTLTGLLKGNGTGSIQTAVAGTDYLAPSSLSATAPITYSGGVIGINQATVSQNGYLSSLDFNTFNNKISSTSLSAGTGITYTPATGVIANSGVTNLSNADSSLTVSAATGAVVISLNPAHANAFTALQQFANSTSTLATANTLFLPNQASTLLKTTATGQVVPAVAGTDYEPAGSYLSGNQTITLTGDVTGTGATTIPTTLATVLGAPGSYGSSTAIPTFTVNGKGLITAAGTAAVIAPAGTLTGTTLASNVVNSSLTSVGTLSNLSVSGQTTLTNASTTNITASGYAIVGNATTSSLYTSQFGINNQYFTSLTGPGLVDSGGVLSLSSSPFSGTYFAQGGNTFGSAGVLGTTDAYPLTFITGNTERARIDTSGHFGIGTTNPNYPLDINSTGEEALFGETGSNDYIGIAANNTYLGYDHFAGDTVLQGASGRGIEFAVNNSTFSLGVAATLTSGGFFGIGTSSPASELTVNGSGYVTGGLGVGLQNTTAGTIQTSGAGSTNALLIGVTGTTTPSFQIDNSAPNSGNGLAVTTSAAGNGVTLSAVSANPSETLTISSKNYNSLSGGSLTLNGGASNIDMFGGNIALTSNFGSASLYLNQQGVSFLRSVNASNSNTPLLQITDAQSTSIPASTESSTFVIASSTRNHAAGALALQRDVRIEATTHSFTTASTLTNAAAFSVDGAPSGGTNATITNSHAIYIPGVPLTNVVNSYGLTVNANTGATNNYAAEFLGGNVGIGTTSPGSLLSIGGVANFTAATSSFYSSGGVNIANGCYSINGVCLAPGGVTSVSNADGSLTISPTTGAVVASLNPAHANAFTALQSFANGTTTLQTDNRLFLPNQTSTLLKTTATGQVVAAVAGTDYQAPGAYITGNQTITLTGDVTGTGATTIPTTLATVNTNVGSFGSSTAIPTFTVNGKGLITAAGTAAVIAPAGTLTGTTLASNVVNSSLTSVGTLSNLTVSGTANLTTASTTNLSVSGYAIIGYGLIGSANLTNATSTSEYTSTFGLNGQYFTSLTGSGLVDSGGVLSLSAAPFSGTYFAQGGNAYGTTAVLGTTDNNPLTFITNNTERARIDTSGHFGIGTTNPNYPLDISATGEEALFGETGSNDYIGIAANNTYLGYDHFAGDTVLQGASGRGIEFAVNNSTFSLGVAATLTSAGNFGIGTSSPANLLSVAGGASIGADYSYAAPTNGLIVEGNVGVGTSTPGSPLSVAGNAYISGTQTVGNLITAGLTANTLIYANASKQEASASVTTPLTFTGGTLSLGTVPVANGGTGSTTLSGLLKGNGTGSIQTAIAGTDYLAPTSLSGGTGITYNSGTGVITNSGVVSFNGRTGAVVPGSSDYTTTQIAEGTNLYFTNARAIASTLTGYTSGAGTISSSDSVLSAIQKLNGNIAALVTGVSSVSNSDGSLTISPTTGAVVASLNPAHANTFTALQQFANSTSTLATANTLFLPNQASTLLKTTATGQVVAAVAGTDYQAPGAYITGNQTITLTGDVTGTGATTIATTLATVLGAPGSYGSSTAIPTFTVNGKGLITAAGTAAVIAPAGTLTGTTLASNVVNSSLTSVGTLTALTLSGQATLGNASSTLLTTNTLFLPNQASTLLKTTATGQVVAAVGDTDYQRPITLTTTGSAGAATFTGDTLNIPNYAGGVTSVSNSDGTLTISPTTGAVVASLNLANNDVWTGMPTFSNPTYSALFTGGNVGIGTTSPGHLLTVAANDTNTNLTTTALAEVQIVNSNTTTPNNYAALAFDTTDTNGAAVTGAKITGIFDNHTPGAVSGDIAFITKNAGINGERMRLTSAGNLGIGTTSPGSLLSIGNTNGINFSTATSTFSSTGGINLSNGCYSINGVCLATGGVKSVTNSDGTLTISSTSGAVVASLNLANANTFTGLQSFANASSTLETDNTLFLPNQASSLLKTTGTGQVVAAVGDTDYQNPITLTTTGTSGAATFTGDTLNIPQYSGGSGTVNTGTTGQFPYYAANGTTLTATSTLFLAPNGNIGIGGTTTPAGLLSINTPGGLTTSYTAPLLYIGSSTAGVSTTTILSVYGASAQYPAGVLNTPAAINCVTGTITCSFFYNGSVRIGFGSPGINFSAPAISGNTAQHYTFTGAADTGIQAGSNSSILSLIFNQTRTYQTGAVPENDNVLLQPPTDTFGTGLAAASVISTSTSFTIQGEPLIGARGSSTLSAGLLIQPDTLNASTTNGIGLISYAPTAAANNYAAEFLGGNVGIGTTSPWRTLSVTGTASFSGLTVAGTTGSALCLSANNEVIVNSGVASCTVSSERFKNTIQSSNTGLAEVLAMNPVTYYLNSDVNHTDQQYGFIAEQADQIDPKLVDLNSQGQIQSFRYDEYTAVLTKAIQQLAGGYSLTNPGLATTSATVASAYAGASAPAITVDSSGDVGIGTTSPSSKLTVNGNGVFTGSVTASSFNTTSFTTSALTASALTASSFEVPGAGANFISQYGSLMLGSTTASSVLSTDGTGVDIYKLALFNTNGVQQLATQTATLNSQLSSLTTRVSALEAGAAAATASLEEASSTSDSDFLSATTSALAGAMNTFGVILQKGVAQFDTLVVRDLVFSSDSNGTSAAGSGKILAGNTTVEIDNPHMLASSQVSVTLTAPMSGNWYVTNKKDGSFQVTISAPQAGDVTFDYLIIQTQGQVATSTADTAGSPFSWLVNFLGGSTTPTASVVTTPTNTASANPGESGTGSSSSSSGTGTASSTNTSSSAGAPVVTLKGGAAISLDQGDAFIDPGASAVDASGTDITSSIVVTGTVDTNTPGMYTLTYTATDAVGHSGNASRVVSITAMAPIPPTTPSAPTTPAAPSSPSAPADPTTPASPTTSAAPAASSATPASSDPSAAPAPSATAPAASSAAPASGT